MKPDNTLDCVQQKPILLIGLCNMHEKKIHIMKPLTNTQQQNYCRIPKPVILPLTTVATVTYLLA